MHFIFILPYQVSNWDCKFNCQYFHLIRKAACFIIHKLSSPDWTQTACGAKNIRVMSSISRKGFPAHGAKTWVVHVLVVIFINDFSNIISNIKLNRELLNSKMKKPQPVDRANTDCNISSIRLLARKNVTETSNTTCTHAAMIALLHLRLHSELRLSRSSQCYVLISQLALCLIIKSLIEWYVCL